MKKGWIQRRLCDVTTKIGSGATPKGGQASYKQSGISLIRSLNVHDGEFRTKDLAFIDDDQAKQLDNVAIEPGDVLLNITGASIARCCVVPDDILPARVNQHVTVLRPVAKQLLPCFLQYMLVSRDYKHQLLTAGEAGATRQALTKGLLEEFAVEFPESLPEQRRIVGILDEAFDGIATAKANAEKNLQNARALFESHLNDVFTKRGEGWVEKPIAECFKVRSGDFLPAKAMVQTGDIDVYGGNGITGKHDKKNLSGENIIIGRVGAKCGNVRHVTGDLWLTDNAFFIAEYFQKFDLGFLSRALERKDLRSTANQAAQPVISYTTIKDVVLDFPISETRQEIIAAKLNAIEAETQCLESIYQRKLAALDELKKSLLHQAFSGQL